MRNGAKHLFDGVHITSLLVRRAMPSRSERTNKLLAMGCGLWAAASVFVSVLSSICLTVTRSVQVWCFFVYSLCMCDFDLERAFFFSVLFGRLVGCCLCHSVPCGAVQHTTKNIIRYAPCYFLCLLVLFRLRYCARFT